MHKRVRQIRHGKDPEDMGGTNIESRSSCSAILAGDCSDARAESGDSEAKRFLNHYMEELKEQFRGVPPPKR